MRKIAGLIGLVAVLGGGAAAGERGPALRPVGELAWSDAPGIPGGRIAVLKGDPRTGPSATLKQIPGGTALGWHTHTASQEVLIVAGTVAVDVEGVGEKEMGPGSWAVIPGSTRHAATCRPGPACLYFEDSSGPSDFKPAAPPAR